MSARSDEPGRLSARSPLNDGAEERQPLLTAASSPSAAASPAVNAVGDAERQASPRNKAMSARAATPLPWRKLSILMAMRLAEPISFTVIFPFVNAMVYEIGATRDKAKVGYYAGLIESLFAFAQCCTILFWGGLSDRVGRKPVLLSGLVGVSCSIILFGLSRTFIAAVFSRALAGAINGNVAVVKSMVGELTDQTNQARAFSLLPLVWSIGCFIGPLLGGYLSKPAQQYPAVFGPGAPLEMDGFWQTYPYFLPCAASATITLLSMLFGSVLLEETLPSKLQAKEQRRRGQQQQQAEVRAGGQRRPSATGSTAHVRAASAAPSTNDSRYGATATQPNPLAQAAGMRPITVRHNRGRSTARVLAHVQSWASGFTPSGSPAGSRDASRAVSRSASPTRQSQVGCAAPTRESAAADRSANPEATSADDADDAAKPTGILGLLSIRQIQSVLLSYACLSFMAVALDAVLVLYLFEPIELGGLGFDTEHTGILLSLTGLGGIIVQLVLFPPLHRRMGSLKLYQASMWAFPLSVTLLPLANGIARVGLAASSSSRLSSTDAFLLFEAEGGGGRSSDLPPKYVALVWTAVVFANALKVVGGMAFSSNMILVNECSRLTKGAALGTLNSLAQLSASLTRAIGPYVASTLFAFSVSHNLLGGQFVWLVLFVAGLLGSLTCLLIRDLEKEREDQQQQQQRQLPQAAAVAE
ncbi:uncharacterized protein PFL1_05980 [Pseudozyma flocculosa PF-1]|uniref:Major facilitator superfamily (MFS) profile domain-containing protein n=2 Tax=Pseudozyma flocculosa TaxID=84751 RepID=A0A5C3F3K2_9BASI|nr:uncharacterized protein PFL1_05980 [Pseudozyma flocculosa PF-1]EPQ26331.1 hypothetical protein PFL1_05980 [Pseudozyma flocculosa PF-1]SPO39084.1 uncharacterized protein PSFLO_04563 [Pseudozyma flocculosa]